MPRALPPFQCPDSVDLAASPHIQNRLPPPLHTIIMKRIDILHSFRIRQLELRKLRFAITGSQIIHLLVISDSRSAITEIECFYNCIAWCDRLNHACVTYRGDRWVCARISNTLNATYRLPVLKQDVGPGCNGLTCLKIRNSLHKDETGGS